ncbi:MAG: hypothetical protein GY717_18055 [Rhodobacteraceae bacterium]|nr:hypothetical protein [Paracoccaceae bacterium]
MSERLHDQEKPAGYLIKVRSDGSATRNDGVELQPAAKNPWYVLMTIAGEQDAGWIKPELHEQNRRYWNGWICADLSEDKRRELATNMGLNPLDLVPLTEKETVEVRAQFTRRLGPNCPLPKPGDHIDFGETHFLHAMGFGGFSFLGVSSFNSASFSSEVEFLAAYFSGYCDFSQVCLSDAAIFAGAKFDHQVGFKDADFLGRAGFEHAKFGGNVTFDGTVFRDTVSFDSAEFDTRSKASFKTVDFSGETTFRSTRLGGDAWFDSAGFSGDAWFESATFSGDAWFESATFSGDAWFESATFSGDAWFESARFSGDAWFWSATFGGLVDFSNKAFGAKTTFTQARFAGGVPKFYQRSFHQDTDFTTQDGLWPDMTAETACESKRAYTRLRQIMSELHKPDDEAFFARQEMRCKALLEGRAQRWLSRGYGVVSDYGHSVMRPLAGLGIVMATPLGAFAALLETRPPGLASFEASGFLIALVKAMGLSFSNTFKFFGLQRVYFADFFKDVDGFIGFATAAQTVLGFVLLFFLGLGLRNRFRLK